MRPGGQSDVSGGLAPAWARADESASILDRFASIAARFPDHDAIRSPGRVLSYRDLERDVAALAAAIRNAGPANAPIAIVADHHPDAVVSILASLAAGHPYTVLDPAVPAARHRLVLDDFGPGILLGTEALMSVAARLAGEDLPMIVVDRVTPSAPNGAFASAGGDSVAGVYYTSGSTGDPKGVVRTHRTILTRTALDAEFGGFGPGDVMSLVYSCSFGTSVNDIFTAI